MYERIAFNVKVESGSTFTFNARRSCNLFYFVYPPKHARSCRRKHLRDSGNPPSGSLFLNGSWPQQNCPHIQQKLTQETQLVNWKPNQLNFSIKIVFLSPDELTVVK